jgi:FkbM family methyltransferase
MAQRRLTTIDLRGRLLRHAPQVRGVRRMRHRWVTSFGPGDLYVRRLPGGARIELRMASPYERSLWTAPEQFDDVKRLRTLLGPGDVFVDCGANVGLWTLVAGTAVGRGGQVVAIEANPDVYGRLARNVELNSFADRCTTINQAVSRSSGMLGFDTGGDFHNVGRVSAEGELEVPAVPLDAVMPDIVNGVKIDVEGHELDVLEGGGAKLLRDRPWVIVEYNADELDSRRLGDWPVDAWLRERGWRPAPVTSPQAPLGPSFERPPGAGHMNLLYRADVTVR